MAISTPRTMTTAMGRDNRPGHRPLWRPFGPALEPDMPDINSTLARSLAALRATVPPEQAGGRLDRFLAAALPI